MKAIFFTATLAIQFLSVLTLKLLDNFGVIMAIFIGCLVAGFSIKYSGNSKPVIKDLGWGLFYGSLTSVVLVLGFMVWLSFNFPR